MQHSIHCVLNGLKRSDDEEASMNSSITTARFTPLNFLNPSCACIILLLVLPAYLVCFAQNPEQPEPLSRAHAHNDYDHARPLLDALDHGFCSIEADIYLVEGKLLVAHNRNKVDANKSLQSLYLEPLRQRAKQNNGSIYQKRALVYLLIDFKSEAESTYRVLRDVLRDYADILTRFDHQKTVTNAVTVIISGNRPRQMMESEPVRYAACDGLIKDLDPSISVHLVPWISENWQSHFKWRGTGAFPDVERKKLLDILDKAHSQGRMVRFWSIPNRPEFWEEIYVAGVDLINADDLSGLKSFLLKKKN